MSALRAIVVVLALATLAPFAGAAVPARKAAATTKAKAAPAKAPAGAKAPAAAAGPRQLDDIHIEGEIAVPQVLFITARDQRRFLDFQHHRYLRTSVAVGGATTFPSRIAVIKSPVLDARKEIAP